MALATITVRVEPNLKKNFDALCEDFGLSVSSAINIFMKAVVREKKIPFEIKTESSSCKSDIYEEMSEEEFRLLAMENFEEMRRTIAENGIKEMSLDEINAEIKAVRDEMAKKE